MRQVLLALVFLLAVVSFPTKAQTPLETRDQWQESMPLLRTALEVEIRHGQEPVRTTWLIWERTPHRYQRILIQDASLPADQAQANQTTFLVHDKLTLAIHGEEVAQPAAPWALGLSLFDQPVEPIMMLSWALGLPGQSYSLDAQPARVFEDHGALSRIEQDGWRIDYEQWSPASGNQPALPQRLRLSRGDTVVLVRVDGWEAHAVLPTDYSEFSIR